MRPELISFKICPFVQRSVITLLEKGGEFDITYIDLQDPPPWFQELSPLGKVPLLKVGETVLFESAVIMEYLDEVTPPSLHPTDPLQKAQNRAWIEFGSELFFAQFQMAMAPDEATFNKQREALAGKLQRLEPVIAGDYFNGDRFHLVDAAYAPFFMRYALLEQWQPQGLLQGCPRLSHWSETLLARPSVRDSVVEDFADRFRNHIANSGGYGAQRFT